MQIENLLATCVRRKYLGHDAWFKHVHIDLPLARAIPLLFGGVQMRSVTVRRVLSSILLPVYLSSCTSWQVQPVSPEQVVTEDQPSKIRVTLTDSSELEMEQPRIVGDTLRGLVKGGADDSLVERDVLLADIATVRVKKTDATKSVLLGVGILAGVAVALVAASKAICRANTDPAAADTAC